MRHYTAVVAPAAVVLVLLASQTVSAQQQSLGARSAEATSARALTGAACTVLSVQDGAVPGPARITFECHAGASDEKIHRATLVLPSSWVIAQIDGNGWAVPAAFVTLAGDGTNVVTVGHGFHDPCTPHSGIIGQPSAEIVVDVDPGSDASGVVTYMLEGDRATFDQSPPAVVCSTGNPCTPDPCYVGYGVTATLDDLTVVGVPVTLQRFLVE